MVGLRSGGGVDGRRRRAARLLRKDSSLLAGAHRGPDDGAQHLFLARARTPDAVACPTQRLTLSADTFISIIVRAEAAAWRIRSADRRRGRCPRAPHRYRRLLTVGYR